jgi:hypothetical protein
MAKDAFDQFWEWANKPLDSEMSIPSDLHASVMALAPEDRLDRAKVNRNVGEARNPDMKYRWHYENGDRLETFTSEATAETWIKENDPEGVLWKKAAAS